MALKLRSYTREFKLKALSRWKAGESVDAVARDVGVRADQLYRWRRKLEPGGREALRGAGRRGWKRFDREAVPPFEGRSAVFEVDIRKGVWTFVRQVTA